MSSRREASQPPVIPGYEYVRLLGMGGFADVFLYRQRMPRRQVAVKVLLASSLDDEARERFRTEADLMASLSHHPSIVTVHQADVATDGRPYLVMEYCSRPSLGQRYRAERMGVAEVLRIGVRLASAVETAHRAGILHRDIKPANVLITDFGWPALTDFGIAATTGLAGANVGMSIPWSPPEMLAEEPTGDARSDVYSLAATIYSLLARRSPFEVPDGSNTAADLIGRIERSTLAPTGRGDVPDSLHAVLARAMDRLPARRYHSALAFARALQQVEAEIMLPLTPLDLPEEMEVALQPGQLRDLDGEAAQETRLRPVQTIHPDEAPPLVPVAVPDPVGLAPVPVPAAPATLTPQFDDVPTTWRGPDRRAPVVPPRPRGWVRVGRVLAGAVVVAAVVTAAVLALRPGSAAPGPSATPTAPPTIAVSDVPAPTDLVGTVTADGSVVFTWTNPDPREGDRYLWGVVEAGVDPVLAEVTATSLTLGAELVADQGAEVCVQVAIVRADNRYSTQPAVGCVAR